MDGLTRGGMWHVGAKALTTTDNNDIDDGDAVVIGDDIIVPAIDVAIAITARKAGKTIMFLVDIVHVVGSLAILRGRLALRLFLVSICRLPSCCCGVVVGGSILLFCGM
jgi:hypothetical protein